MLEAEAQGGRRGAKAFLAANITSQISALLRYAILARLLGPQELGIAAMVILTAHFFEAISDTGSDRFLVQDADGDSPKLQGFVHLVLALRGLLIAAGLVLTAPFLSSLYRVPDLAPALMALAIAPLIGAFVHQDLRRVQRQADFRPESLAVMVSELLSLAATAAAAVVTRDHTAVLYGLVTRAVALTLVSHLTAKRPYRWAYAREERIRFSAFALPLFLNGILLFVGSQGDRLLIARGLGPAALGHYSAALLLVYYPTSMLQRFLSGIHLPEIAGRRDKPEEFAAEREKLGGRTVLLAIAAAAGYAAVGPVFTPLFFGPEFKLPLFIFAMLGVLQAARFLRLWPTVLAVSIGKSTIVMFNNVARMVALPLAFLANLQFQALTAVVGAFVLGEIAALLVALALLARAGAVSLSREVSRVGLFLAGCALTMVWSWGLHRSNATLITGAAVVTLPMIGVIIQGEKVALADAIKVVQERINRLRSGRRG